MKLQRLMSYVRKAVDDYDMIHTGDHIAVGLSGGKDSIALLMALNGLRRFYPNKFELEAITVSLGFENMDFSPMIKLCEQLGVRYTIEKTDIGEIIFDERKESNPCSLCSKMRKGALNETAKKHGCNKIALGHNKDDVIQTFLLSLFYEGRLNTFAPVTYLDRMGLYSIRPLIYVREKDVRYYINKNGLEVIKNNCPANGYTKREEVKNLIYSLEKQYSNLDEKIFGAIQRAKLSGWENNKFNK